VARARLLLWLATAVSLQAATLVPIVADTNATIRIMAANLTGDSQTYADPALRIFQGLDPDVVAIQEFRYLQNRAADFRALVDVGFGTNYVYYRESGYDSGIPNGVISRFPILASGSWPSGIDNRGFAWARIDIPGTNDLFVVSVHLKASSSDAATRATQAANLRTLIQANIPTNAWLVVAGDFNLQNRSETALTTLKTFLVDDPIPTDAETGGNPNTNEPRSRPYDLVLPNPGFRALLTPATVGSRTFPNSLVFDSRVFVPLAAVTPVQATDSGTAQHMAVLKDFRIPYRTTNWLEVPPPVLSLDRNGILSWTGLPALTYRVQSSPDLATWSVSASVSSATPHFTCTNSLPTDTPSFWRVIAP
jgi:endonuclease/exonuclease/phosphatase family metal-dependent hydrolase